MRLVWRDWGFSFLCAAASLAFAALAGPSLNAFNGLLLGYHTPPPPDDPCYECGEQVECPEGDPNGGNNSPHPVGYGTGRNALSFPELRASGLSGWAHGRSYVSETAYTDGLLGPGWRVGGLLSLSQNGEYVQVVAGGTGVRSFSVSASTYTPLKYYQEKLVADAANHTLVFTDTQGRRWTFFDLSAFWNPARRGKLKEAVDPAGNLTTLVYSSVAGPTLDKILEAQQTLTGAPTTHNRFVYTYNLSGVASGRLASVTHQRTVAGVSGVVRKVDYVYYPSTGPNGPAGSLQWAKVSDGTQVLDVVYHRYNALDAQGRLPLRYVLLPRGYERALAALGTEAAIEASSDAALAQWATYYFEYDTQMRVTKEVVQGQGCGCGSAAGKGTYTYAYTAATHGATDGPNAWKTKCVETLPDGNQNIVYTSFYNSTMLHVFKEVATGLQWRTYYRYDAQGRQQIKVMPSAMLGHDESLPDLVGMNSLTYVSPHISTSQGLSYWFDYDSNGFKTYDWARQGQNGGSGGTVLRWRSYVSHVGDTGTVYKVAQEGGPYDLSGTWANVNYAYTWEGTSNRVASRVTQHEAISGAENGSGVPTSFEERFDTYGRPIWRKDEDGFIHAAEYDALSGAATRHIVDVNTTTSANEPPGWVTPTGGGLHLSTVIEVDALGRPTGITDPAGRVTYTVYKDVEHETRVYPGWNATTNLPTGPTRVSREDRARGYLERLSMSAVPATLGGRPTGSEAISNLLSLERSYQDVGERVTHTDSYRDFAGVVYSAVPDLGAPGTNYYRRAFNYDLRGRQDRDQDWTGTVTRLVYDAQSRLAGLWIGTDDVPTVGDWSPTNTAGTDLVKVRELRYDGGGVGDGHLTLEREFTAPLVSLDTTHQYDFRGRAIRSRGPDRMAVQRTFDNLDRPWIEETFADEDLNFAMGPSERRGKRESRFDKKGSAYLFIAHHVDSVTGALGNRISTRLWFNARGLSVKSATPNGLFTKTRYDGAGRPSASYLSFDPAETAYVDADDVVGDTVIEQRAVAYDASSFVIQATSYSRVPTSAKLGELSSGWAVADSRRTFTAEWFDLAGRSVSEVDYGTNGGSNLSRPASPPAPNSSNNYIVTKYDYDAAGNLYRITNNLNRITHSVFDALRRETRRIENYVDGVAAESEQDADRTTDDVYDALGRLSERVAYNPKGTGFGTQSQATRYVYGTATHQATPAVVRNDLVAAIILPDSDDQPLPGGPPGGRLSNGADGIYDRLELAYDLAGRPISRKDPAGTVLTSAYDVRGRLLSRTVSSLGAGVDGAVRRIEYGYDSLSRPELLSSFDAVSGGSLLNQIKATFDGWGNVSSSSQSHAGAVIGATPSFQTAFADGAVAGEAKFVRVASRTYPNGRQVLTEYPGTHDDKLNRPGRLSHPGSGPVFAEFTYLGADDVVKVAHPAVSGGFQLDFGAGTGHPAGWDRFGRVLDQRWGDGVDPLKFDRQQHGYNRVSDRLTRDLTYTGAPVDRDEQYTYDNLHRLKTMKRGTLSGTAIPNTSSTYNLEWNSLEARGNWRTHRWDPNGGVASGGTLAWTTQSRKHNRANEIDVDDNDANAAGASITGTGANWVDPAYDKAGNVKNGPKPGDEAAPAARHHYTYDAFDRLVKIQADNGAGAPGVVVAEYQYDGRHRRIVKLVPNGANWDRTDVYYNTGWRRVEERAFSAGSKTAVATVPRFQYVWDPRYVDAPVLRDENKDGDSDCVDGGDERLFYAQDSAWNVTALVSVAGVVVERYAYTPYGGDTVFDAAWSPRAQSAYGNDLRFGGYVKDVESGLLHVRARQLHPTLGRWIQRDPAFYLDSLNLYEYAVSRPTRFQDPSGALLTLTYSEERYHETIEEATSEGSGRGVTIANWSGASYECVGPGNCTLAVKGNLDLLLKLLRVGHEKWQKHNSRYDKRWGADRGNLGERAATLAHERDHARTFQDFIAKANAEIAPRERKYLSSGNCNATGRCVVKKVNEYFVAAKAHSASFDQPPWWDGGRYDDHPFDEKLDLKPCDRP